MANKKKLGMAVLLFTFYAFVVQDYFYLSLGIAFLSGLSGNSTIGNLVFVLMGFILFMRYVMGKRASEIKI